MRDDGEISAGTTEDEPDIIDVSTKMDADDSLDDPDRRDLVEEYARRHGIDLGDPPFSQMGQ